MKLIHTLADVLRQHIGMYTPYKVPIHRCAFACADIVSFLEKQNKLKYK